MAPSSEHLRARLSGRACSAARLVSLPTVAVAAATLWLGYNHGGFPIESRNPFAIGIWWAVLVGVGVAVLPFARPAAEAVVAVAFLAGLAGWTLASAAWAPSGEAVLSEFDLAALYLGVFVITIIAARRATADQWADGLAIGIGLVAVLALASRLRPGLFPGSGDVAAAIPSASSRLSYPIGYWNGLAALAALGFPLLFRIALAGRSTTARSLALAGIPVLATTIYLTSSRGGAVAAALGVAVLVALTDRRWQALGAIVVGGLGSVLAILVFATRDYLTNGGTGALANAQGRSAALLVAAVVVGTGAAFAFALRIGSNVRLPPAWVGRALAAVAALVLVAGLVAAHPIRRFDHFRAPPATGLPSDVDTTAHLFSSAGNGRWQFWSAAASQFRHHPLIGDGAGSYGRWWNQHGSFAYTTEHAHSLYLETLGELGIVGLLLLLGGLSAAVVAVGRRIRTRRDRDLLMPALAGALAAYLLSAGIDWVWELPAITGVAFVVLGLLVGPATSTAPQPRAVPSPPREDRTTHGHRLAPRLVGLALAWLILCAQALPLLAQLKISSSQAAVRAADTDAALGAARAARALEPWAASPYLQLALVEEQSGDVRSALGFIHAAIRRDRSDWRVWLVAARLEVKAGRSDEARASVAHVRALNPRSPLLQPLYRDLSP